MKRQLVYGTVCSAALAAAVSAQTGAQTPAQSGSATNPNSQQVVTVTGCLQSGSPSGTSTLGASSPSRTPGDTRAGAEFILTNVTTGGTSMSSAAGGADSRTGGGAGSASATGSTGAGTAKPTTGGGSATGDPGSGAVSTDSGGRQGSPRNGYRLTGNVGDMNKLVNRRVEVTGTLDPQSGVEPGKETVSGARDVGSSGAAAGTRPGGGTSTSPGAGSTVSTPGATGSDPSMQGTPNDFPSLRITSIREIPGDGSCSSGRQQ